jgi:hypothetical protein
MRPLKTMIRKNPGCLQDTACVEIDLISSRGVRQPAPLRPDRLVLDYSPIATLAARIAVIPCVLIGNGFELPPATNPLPPFPGFSWATPERAAESERIVLANANAVT